MKHISVISVYIATQHRTPTCVAVFRFTCSEFSEFYDVNQTTYRAQKRYAFRLIAFGLHSLPCCPLTNEFYPATRAYRHLANGTKSENGTDRQTDKGIAAFLYAPTVGRGHNKTRFGDVALVCLYIVRRDGIRIVA